MKDKPVFKTEKEMFLWIWNNRPHISELSGRPLLPTWHVQWHWQFLHVLPKGSYPSEKLNPDNIMLGLPDEHSKQEQFPKFVARRQELTRIYHSKNYKR